MTVSKGSAAELVGRRRDADRSLAAACLDAFAKLTVRFLIVAAVLAVTAVGGCAEPSSSELKSIAWSPDSKHLLSGGFDGEVRVQEVASGESTIVHRPRTPFINTVQWSPDGQRLLVITDQTVELLDTRGKEIVDIVVSPPLQEESFPVYQFPIEVAFSPTGERLALAGWRDGQVLIVDARSGRTERVFKDIPKEVSSISWAPNGKQLFAGAWDQTVRTLDLEAGKQTSRMEVALSGGWVEVEVSPDGKRIAWHGYQTDTWLRNIQEGSELRIVVPGGTESVAWSPDGNSIAVLGSEAVHLWDVESGVERKSLLLWVEVREQKSVPALDAEGSRQPDVSRFRRVLFDRVLWSPDGQYVAALSHFEGPRIWSVRTGKQRNMRVVAPLAFSPDMRFIAVGEKVTLFSRF